MDALRLFIGVRAPRPVRDEIESTRRRLEERLGNRAVRWVDPENYHLTLLFLGETPAGLVEQLLASLRAAALAAAAHSAETAGGPVLGPLGAFPSAARPRTIVVTVDDRSGDLREIHLQLRRELAACAASLAIDDRPLRPHVTLGYMRRDAGPRERRAVPAALREVRPSPLPFPPERLTLIRSVTGPGGSRYTDLGSTALDLNQS